jgi:hypothetical protein
MDETPPAILDKFDVSLVHVIVERRLAAPEKFAGFLDSDEVFLFILAQGFLDSHVNGIFYGSLDDGTDDVLQIISNGNLKFHIS